MRVFWVCLAVLPAASSLCWGQSSEPAQTLIREVVYNELHDHDTHGYWRYWIQQRVQNNTRLEQQVETADGPITRVVQTNGHPVDARTRDAEQQKLERLMDSPRAQASHRRDYQDDQKHVTLIMEMLPDAYLFEYVAEEEGCHHLRFRPNPSYVPHSVEARVIHSMGGDLWIDARMKRLSRLEAHLAENVDFGFGLLGRVEKGGWFTIERVQVSSTEWKTQRMELHLSGRAVLFKTIARDTNEVRGGFAAVPAGLNLAQGMRLLEQSDPGSAPDTFARISPASFRARH